MGNHGKYEQVRLHPNYIASTTRKVTLSKERAKQRLVAYNNNPVLCLNCQTPLPYKNHTIKKFCSRSCSASYCNLKKGPRTEEVKKKIKETLLKNNALKPRKEEKEKVIKQRFCRKCCKEVEVKKYAFCNICRENFYLTYRSSAQFRFSIRDYSFLFSEKEFQLIKEKGMYSPVNKRNNLKGVSKDHMFSVSNGFKLGISAEIISHPANCKLLIHTENMKKSSTNSISFLELLKRIIRCELKKTTYSKEFLDNVKDLLVLEEGKSSYTRS